MTLSSYSWFPTPENLSSARLPPSLWKIIRPHRSRGIFMPPSKFRCFHGQLGVRICTLCSSTAHSMRKIDGHGCLNVTSNVSTPPASEAILDYAWCISRCRVKDVADMVLEREKRFFLVHVTVIELKLSWQREFSLTARPFFFHWPPQLASCSGCERSSPQHQARRIYADLCESQPCAQIRKKHSWITKPQSKISTRAFSLFDSRISPIPFTSYAIYQKSQAEAW